MTYNIINQPSPVTIKHVDPTILCVGCNKLNTRVSMQFYKVYEKDVVVCNQVCIANWIMRNPTKKINGRF